MGLRRKRMRGDVLWPSSRAILSFLCIHWGIQTVVGLKLDSVEVPKSGIVGGSVTLGCEYTLEADTLFSLKWQKDGHEFFKFLPGAGNKDFPMQSFNQPGVDVDMGESLKIQHGRVRLRLRNLTLDSAGVYKCEISADRTFQTLQNGGNLSIMALPPSPTPVLTGFPPVVHFAEKINGNCTFPETYPAAEITLYLNNAKINSSNGEELVEYEPVKVGKRLTTTVGIRFRVASKYFKFGVLQIRCEARLLDQKWSTLLNITQNYQPFYTAGQNRRYSSGDCSSRICLWRILFVFILATGF